MIQAYPRTAGLQQMGYIVCLSFTHGHGRAERQFRATRLVKMNLLVVIISTCGSEVVLDSYFLVCSVLPLLYREGAECNLGLLEQGGC